MTEKYQELHWAAKFVYLTDWKTQDSRKGVILNLHKLYFHQEEFGITDEESITALDEAIKELGEDVVQKIFLDHISLDPHVYDETLTLNNLVLIN